MESTRRNFCNKNWSRFLQVFSGDDKRIIDSIRAYTDLEVKRIQHLQTSIKRYETWCQEQKTNKISKSIIMDRLRKEKLLVARATVKGKTKQNVIIGYELKESKMENS